MQSTASITFLVAIPESFKVLLKELQALGLDVRVLREDRTEVEIMETIDYGDADYRYEMDDDRKYDNSSYDSASLGEMGYQAQEFNEDGELEAADDDYFMDDDYSEDGMDDSDEF